MYFRPIEDAIYYLWRERKLPVNVDPSAVKLTDARERERLARLFERTLGDAVGHVLPLGRPAEDAPWQSGTWHLRRERCYLIPGDSPLGYRLPLDSQPWVEPADYPHVHPPDPTQEFAALAPSRAFSGADSEARRQVPTGLLRPPFNRRTIRGPSFAPRSAPRRAASVLYIFMPPTRILDDYLEILAAVEAAAEEIDQPVIIEGYEPPPDPRLAQFQGHAGSGRHRGQCGTERELG